MNRIAIVIVALVAAACGASGTRPRSVAELADDPLVLQGLVERCAADPKAAARDPECLNARLALDRLGAAADREHDPERDAEFARERELRRQHEERARPRRGRRRLSIRTRRRSQPTPSRQPPTRAKRSALDKLETARRSARAPASRAPACHRQERRA